MHHSSIRKSGFSLVELSIVLVILGLLTGGILGGKSLIDAAELRAVTTEFSQWQTAVNTYRQKYMDYPGDMETATRFWPDDTDNGNGDGVIGYHGSAYGGSDQPTEHFLFWQHLALAGLIQGEYTGESATGSSWHHAAGENAPVSKFGSASWAVDSTSDHENVMFDVPRSNVLEFGMPGVEEMVYGAAMTPEEAWNIDAKLDDGLPGKGGVVAIRWNDCTNATARTMLDSVYELAEDSALCSLMFRNGI